MALTIEPMLYALLQNFFAVLPNILWATIIVVLGFILGKILGHIVEKVLVKAKVDQNFSVKDFGVKLSSVLAVLVKWAVYLIVLQAAADILDISALTITIGKIIDFIPRIAEAVVIIVAANAIGVYIKKHIIGSNTFHNKLVADFSYFLILYVGIATALPLLGINTTLINYLLLLIVGAISIGLAIALGWGLKDTVREMSRDYEKLLKKR